MDVDVEAFVADLATLVGFRTIVRQNPDQFRAANAFLLDEVLGDVDVEVDEYQRGGVTTLLVRRRGSERPRLLVDTHVEVVPGDDELFELRREDDRLVGRGAIDMKTQLLVCAWVLRDRLRRGEADDAWLLVCEDEEVGSRAGTAVVVDDLARRDLLPRYAFVPDGGPDFTAVAGEKGIVHARLEARGTGAHGSRPWLADNPVDTLMSVRERLLEASPRRARRRTGARRWR